MRKLSLSIQNKAKLQNLINLWLVIFLLFIRIPFVLVLNYFSKPIPQWVDVGYNLVSYLLLLVLFWNNQASLDQYNIDKSSFIILVLFSTFLRIRLPIENANPAIIYVFWIASIGYVILLVRNWSKLQFVKIKWLLLGIISGIVLIYFSIQIRFNPEKDFGQWGTIEYLRSVVGYYASFVYTIGHTATYEEIVFRGFLWGLLRDKKWNEFSICLFQAFLFFVAHIYYYEFKLGWFFILGLVFGWLASRSKSTTPGMISHALSNGYFM